MWCVWWWTVMTVTVMWQCEDSDDVVCVMCVSLCGAGRWMCDGLSCDSVCDRVCLQYTPHKTVPQPDTEQWAVMLASDTLQHQPVTQHQANARQTKKNKIQHKSDTIVASGRNTQPPKGEGSAKDLAALTTLTKGQNPSEEKSFYHKIH